MVLLKKTGMLVFVLGMIVPFCVLPAMELPSWDFKGKDAKEWVARAHQCKSVRAEDGILKGVTSGTDPFLTSPNFSLPATAGQVVEFRAKCSIGGLGELFWIPKGAQRAQQKWSASFKWIGDGEWHDYKVRPFWQGEKEIAAFRLDFVNGRTDAVVFELSSIRIVSKSGVVHTGDPSWQGAALSAWTPEDGAKTKLNGDAVNFSQSEDNTGVLVSPMLSVDSDEYSILAVEMAVPEGETAIFRWACDKVSGVHQKKLKIIPDGRFHIYNIDLWSDKSWMGRVVQAYFLPLSADGSSARIRSIRFCDDPQGPADISIVQARPVNAINRGGAALPLFVQIKNSGGKDAEDLRLSVKSLPSGVKIQSGKEREQLPTVPSGEMITHRFALESSSAVSGSAEFYINGAGADKLIVSVPIQILSDLKLPKAGYVPVPKPLKSDYEVGALYFPGWSQASAWARVWSVAPERKPVLGLYDEANPEVVDWQIKWAVENGLSYFLVDWYWHKEHQHHDHWIKAFQKARYKSYLKFALMWANHNAAGSHSIEDQRKVTEFWIKNYFNMPEYYRIDDKPVVMIWSPQNMQRDIGEPDGCRKLLELSRQMARAAGYKGIYFIAMKWPEASTDPAIVKGLKDMGFDMTSLYHFMDHGGKAKNPRRFSFDLVVDASAPFWRARHETGILPFLPNLSTGWDSRPWHGDKAIEIYGRTADHFRRICRDAKKFADESGVKRLMLAPLNEWGEGSYAEPCAEFGFGMYEAVRETFCRKPKAGWPLNYTPVDVGLGPYDLPLPEVDDSTAWDFKSGMQGWRAMMGITACKVEDEGMTFTTTTHDPAICRSIMPIRAKNFQGLAVRMKIPAGTKGHCQFFWSSGGIPTEVTCISLPLMGDGTFRDYLFKTDVKRAWRGRIKYLRFDPCFSAGVPVVIDSVRLIPAAR